MPKKEYTTDDVMLTLAAIAYCGFHLTLPEPEKRARMRHLMTEMLQQLGPVKGQWEIVWGPVSFRSAFSGFDDAAMYVAQNRIHPSCFVVAVRGTNPMSLFDWIFGDLMVMRQIPWPYGDRKSVEGASISFSTALSLSIHQHMRWEPTGPDTATELWTAITHTISHKLRDAGSALLHRVADDLREPLGRLRGDLQSGMQTVATSARKLTPDSLDQWAEAVRRQQTSGSAYIILNAFDGSLKLLEGTHLDPLRLVLGGTRLRSVFASGITLQDFLAAAVANAKDPVEINVTGHSKGGALSPTLALWLADTQGPHVPEDDRWDPDRKATVHAYSFAGPTAGNGTFAAHSNAVIGPRCYRIVNQLDIVPHVWAVCDLNSIPTLYRLPAAQQAILKGLTDELVRAVGILDYQHVGNHVTNFPGVFDSEKSLLLQVVYQHLDGYFEQMGLQGEMSTAIFFNPLA